MSNHAALKAGNVAVITGAADGIGLASAMQFASLGMNVLMADNNQTTLDASLAQVKQAGAGFETRIATALVDVAEISQVRDLKQRAFTEFGRVNVLMNNAGTSRPTGSWQGLDEWQLLFAVNLWGILHGMHTFTDAMVAQNEPAVIINTGSKQGITNPPGNPGYNATKAAVKSATESLQHELRSLENCQVSAHLLVPGYTFTGLTRRRTQEKPAAAWSAEQVATELISGINEGRFYIICPDNEVSREDDQRRILWAAGDLAYQRSPLSRWDPEFSDAFNAFSP